MPKGRVTKPLIGREDLLRDLKGELEEAAGGSGSFILLHGEVGVGKSRVVAALMDMCDEMGFTVHSSRCTFSSGGRPYLPIEEALGDRLTGASRGSGDGRGGGAAPMGMIGMGVGADEDEVDGGGSPGDAVELKAGGAGARGDDAGPGGGMGHGAVPMGLLPMAAAGAPPAPDRGPAFRTLNGRQMELGRDRMFTRVRNALVKMTDRAPAAVILEDLQWAPDGTLQMLRYLARNLRDRRVLILATFRADELTPESRTGSLPFHDFIDSPETRELFTGFELGRLDVAGVKALVAHLFGGKQPPDNFVRWIHKNTDGNPLFVEELIDNLTQDGHIDQTNFRWFRELDTADLHVPSTLKEVVLKRIRKLDITSKKVLQIASALGRTFDFKVLEQVSEMPEERLLDALDIILDQKLIIEEPGSDQELYKFENAIIQEMAYSELNRSRKRRLHNRAGEVMETIYQDALNTVVYDLSNHFYKGQNHGKAVYYLMKAGSDATELFAFQEAAGFYKRAKISCERLPPSKDTQGLKMEVLNRLGHISALTGDWMEALEYNRELIRLADELDDVLRKAEAHRHIGDIQRQRGIWDEAVSNYEKALELSEGVGELYGIFDAHKGLGHVHWRLGEFDDAIDHFNQILNSAEQIHDTYIQAIVFIDLGNVYAYQDRYEEAAEYFNKSIATLEEVVDRFELSRAYNNLGDVYMKMERWDEAMDCFNRSAESADKSGNIQMSAWSRFNRAECLINLGDLARARELCEEALPELTRLDNKIGMSAAHRNLGMIEYLEGKIPQGDAQFRRSLDILAELKSPAEEGETYFKQASCLLKAGARERARKAFHIAEEKFTTIGASRHLNLISESLAAMDGDK